MKNEDLILNFFNTLEKEILRSQVVQKASKAYKKVPTNVGPLTKVVEPKSVDLSSDR